MNFKGDNQENLGDQEIEFFDEGYIEEDINEKKEENYMKYLIGIAIVIGVGWYLISEPFSTKVDRVIDENSNWNPTTILEDPDAYIYGALQHLDSLEKNLKEEKFRVNTRLNQMTREQESGERILLNLNDDIKRWKNDYKILDGRIEGVTQTKGYDKATLRDLIIQADMKRNGQQQKMDFYPNAIINLEGMIARIEQGLSDLQVKRMEVEIARTNLRVNSGDDSINEIRDSINSITDNTNALVTDVSRVSLENAQARDAKSNMERDFESILGD